jgi:hypothetical protein
VLAVGAEALPALDQAITRDDQPFGLRSAGRARAGRRGRLHPEPGGGDSAGPGWPLRPAEGVSVLTYLEKDLAAGWRGDG